MWRHLLALDAQLSERLRVAEKQGGIRTLASLLAHSGDSWFWLFGLIVIWLVGNSFWKWISIVAMVSIILTAALVLTIKFTVRRRRPGGEWGMIYRKTDPHSFPSGHAVRAALLAVLAMGLTPLWIGALLLIWAPLVMIARVAMGVHYLSDVLAGAVFGFLIGFLILNLLPHLSGLL